jgi:hypothetical protein
MRACWVNSAAKTAPPLPDGSDPEERARIATRWSSSVTCSPIFAPLRLPQGGDQPSPTTIDNHLASHDIAVANPLFGVTETSVRFAPN